jgi:hypothetical protein
MGDKTNLKPVFWLFQTIFPKRMGKKAPNQIIRPIFLREIVHNNKKTGFYAVFFYFGTLWAPPNESKKGTQRFASGQDVWPNVST